MKILHVITGLRWGGAERQLLGLLEHSRHEPAVIGLYDFGHTGRAIQAMGIPVESLELPRNYDPRAIPQLVRRMKAGRFDLVHTHLYRATVYGRIAARFAGVPRIVTTEHSIGERELEGRPVTRRIRALYMSTERFSDRTIAVSPWVADLLRSWGVDAAKISVIPDGIETEAFRFDPTAREAVRVGLGVPLDATVIGTVGRLVERKQQDLLLQASASLIEEGAWLVVVGDGPKRAELEALANRLGIRPRTVFTGERHDIAQLLSALDAFASPAFEEMFGIAPVEALIAGLPVVVTHCPALDGIEEPRVYRSAQGIEDLERSVRRAIDQPPDRTGIPPDLRGRFEIRSVAAQIDDLYEAIVPHRRA